MNVTFLPFCKNKGITRKSSILAVILIMVVFLCSCNTMVGVARDIKKAGETMEEIVK